MKKFAIILLIILCAVLAATLLEKPEDTRTLIKFSSWGSQSETELLIPLIKEFEKENPEIKVEFVHIPQNYFQKLHLLFASKLEPDVVFINNFYAPKYINAGLLKDLTPHIEKDEYFEKALQGFTRNGKIYAVPRDISNLVIYYNKDIFDKNKVPYPSSSWTMKEYIKTAKLLTKKGFWGTSYDTEAIYWLPFVFSKGGNVLSDDGEKIILDKKAIDALNFYSDMANKLNIAPKKSQSASLTMAQMFLQQKVAMHLSGRWLTPKYRQEASFNWDIAPFPSDNKGSIVGIDSSGYALSKSSKHKKEALKFIKFISKKESLETLTKSGLIVPARKDTAFGDVFLDRKQKPEHAEFFIKAIETGKPTPINQNYQQITDRLQAALEPLFLGKKNAREVITPKLIIDLSRFVN